MVSNASDDLPDPDTPVITVNFSWGMESEMFLRLWTRAPWIRIKSSTGISIIRLRGSDAGFVALHEARAVAQTPPSLKLDGCVVTLPRRPLGDPVRDYWTEGLLPPGIAGGQRRQS